MASAHPAATPPRLSAQMLELRARPEHLGLGGVAGIMRDRAIPGEILAVPLNRIWEFEAEMWEGWYTRGQEELGRS